MPKSPGLFPHPYYLGPESKRIYLNILSVQSPSRYVRHYSKVSPEMNHSFSLKLACKYLMEMIELLLGDVEHLDRPNMLYSWLRRIALFRFNFNRTNIATLVLISISYTPFSSQYFNKCNWNHLRKHIFVID